MNDITELALKCERLQQVADRAFSRIIALEDDATRTYKRLERVFAKRWGRAERAAYQFREELVTESRSMTRSIYEELDRRLTRLEKDLADRNLQRRAGGGE